MSDNPRFGYMLDGKPVKKFLFARWYAAVQAYQLCMVEAFDKDHAVKRIVEHYKGTETREWDFLDEVPPESFISSKIGDTLELVPYVHREGAIVWRQ